MENRREWLAKASAIVASLLAAGKLRGAAGGIATPAMAVQLAAADLAKLPKDERRYQRFLWISDATGKERRLAYEVLCGHVNALSRSPRITVPVAVLNDGTNVTERGLIPFERLTLLRLRYDDFKYDPKTWDRLQEQDAFFHATLVEEWPGGFDPRFGREFKAGRYRLQAQAPWLAESPEQFAALRFLVDETASRCPILDGCNFFWQTSIQADRAVGYYGLLEIKDRADFEKLAGFHRSDLEQRPELLAVPAASEIAQQWRRVGRFASADGAMWVTFDNSKSVERRNPVLFLKKGFVHAAEESFLKLPNGMWATGLFNGDVDKDGRDDPKGDGKRQDSAPDFIGYHKGTASNDGRIHNYLTCFSCHDAKADQGGLRDFDDWVRNFGEAGQTLATKDRETFDALRDNYSGDLKKALVRDRQAYIDALHEANQCDPQTHAAQMVEYFKRYDAPVDLARAGRFLGFAPDIVSARVSAYSNGKATREHQNLVAAIYGEPAEKRKSVPIDQFHEQVNLLSLECRGLIQWPEELRKKVLR